MENLQLDSDCTGTEMRKAYRLAPTQFLPRKNSNNSIITIKCLNVKNQHRAEEKLARTGSPSSLLFSSLLCKPLTKRSKQRIILEPSQGGESSSEISNSRPRHSSGALWSRYQMIVRITIIDSSEYKAVPDVNHTIITKFKLREVFK